MNEIIQEILTEVFPGENTAPYAPRLEMLYGMVFQMAKPEEYPRLKSEIVECERHYADNTRLEAEKYSAMTPEMAVRMFAGLAFVLAKTRYRTGQTLLCAGHLSDIFTGLLNSGMVPRQVEQDNRRRISDALVDYNYASGFSDNLSFRMHDFIF